MDYATAQQRKIEIFRAVKNSVFVDADTNLWYLAYLYNEGYSMDYISKIQGEMNGIMLDQLNGVYDCDHPSFKELSGLLSREIISK